MGTTADTITELLGPGNYRRIARGAGLTPQHVARVVRGEKGASLHSAASIARAADVSLDQLYDFILRSPTLNIQGRRTIKDGPRKVRKRARKAVRAASRTRRTRRIAA